MAVLRDNNLLEFTLQASPAAGSTEASP